MGRLFCLQWCHCPAVAEPYTWVQALLPWLAGCSRGASRSSLKSSLQRCLCHTAWSCGSTSIPMIFRLESPQLWWGCCSQRLVSPCLQAVLHLAHRFSSVSDCLMQGHLCCLFREGRQRFIAFQILLISSMSLKAFLSVCTRDFLTCAWSLRAFLTPSVMQHQHLEQCLP